MDCQPTTWSARPHRVVTRHPRTCTSSIPPLFYINLTRTQGVFDLPGKHSVRYGTIPDGGSGAIVGPSRAWRDCRSPRDGEALTGPAGCRSY
jgi:hypothetical protein